jgi:hypothetical protein
MVHTADIYTDMLFINGASKSQRFHAQELAGWTHAPLGHPDCILALLCSPTSSGSIGVFTRVYVEKGKFLTEHGGDHKTEHDARHQTEPTTHCRWVSDGAGTVLDGLPWRKHLQPECTPEFWAAQVQLPWHQRTPFTWKTNFEEPGVSPQTGSHSLSTASPFPPLLSVGGFACLLTPVHWWLCSWCQCSSIRSHCAWVASGPLPTALPCATRASMSSGG